MGESIPSRGYTKPSGGLVNGKDRTKPVSWSVVNTGVNGGWEVREGARGWVK